MNISNIILIIVIIILIYLIYNFFNKENFASSSQELSLEAVSNIQSIFNQSVTLPNFTIDELDIQGNFNYLPRGIIMGWNGTITNIPQGWALCDGTKGTPDLRNRFIIGIGQGSNLSNYNLNSTGGNALITLGIENIPPHNHGFSYVNPNGSRGGCYDGDGNCPQSNGRVTNSTGGGKSFNILPPYYTLFFVMKE